MTGNDPDGENKRSVRQYTPDYERVLDKLTTDYKFEAIYFDDDTFNIGNSHTVEISKLAGKYNIPWFAMYEMTLVKDTWKIMKDNGYKGVKIGIDSGIQIL